MRHVLAAAAATVLLSGAAHAQVAPPATDAPVSSDRTADQIDAWLNEPVRGVAPTQEASAEAPPVRDRAIHGEVGAAIGSNGYRSAYGVANMPLGADSDLTVAVAGAHSDGFKGPGGSRWGGGDSKSLAISLRLGSAGPRTRGYCSTPRWGVWVPSDYGRVDGGCGVVAPIDNRRRPLLTHEDDLWNSAPAF